MHSGNTEMLGFGNGHQSTIILRDTSNPSTEFRAPIADRMVIGRAPASDIQTVLEFDAAVSARHCEIIKKGSLYFINDLHSSNKTYYNDMEVMAEMPIMSGGVVTIGKHRYTLTIEET